MAEINPNRLYDQAVQISGGFILHIRWSGESRDVSLENLRLNSGSSDAAVRLAVASFLDVSERLLESSIVERHANGNMTLRPEAVFG